MLERILFILFGRPNGGKGSFIDQIREMLRVSAVGAGDLCRKEKEKDSELWKKAHDWMTTNRSTLWPTEMLWEAVVPWFKENAPSTQHVFADGILRKADQVPAIINLYREYEFRRLVLIEVRTSPEECADRAAFRKRADDGDIHKRLADYEIETVPAIHQLMCSDLCIDKLTLDGSNMRSDKARYAQALMQFYSIPKIGVKD